MVVPFFDLARQTAELLPEIREAIADVVQSGKFILGPNVKALEKEMADYCGGEHAIAVASGTDALHLALRAMGVGPGDEVITSPFTFIATAEAISYTGAKPVFADIDPTTFNIDPTHLEKCITSRTKAILPVHLYGLSADVDAIRQAIGDRDIKILEDAAQAIGAEYKGAPVGSLGDAAIFSFYPTKNLGAFGDGGMIVTKDAEIANRVRVLAAHGGKNYGYYDELGFNSRLDEMQAAIIRTKMKHLDGWNKKRRGNAQKYQSELSHVPVTLPSEPGGYKHVYHQFTIRVPNREALRTFLQDKGIGSGIYYPLAVHRQVLYKNLPLTNGNLRESELAQDQVLSLPIFPELTEPETGAVIGAVQSFYRGAS